MLCFSCYRWTFCSTTSTFWLRGWRLMLSPLLLLNFFLFKELEDRLLFRLFFSYLFPLQGLLSFHHSGRKTYLSNLNHASLKTCFSYLYQSRLNVLCFISFQHFDLKNSHSIVLHFSYFVTITEMQFYKLFNYLFPLLVTACWNFMIFLAQIQLILTNISQLSSVSFCLCGQIFRRMKNRDHVWSRD